MRQLVELARTPTDAGLMALWWLLTAERNLPIHVADWSKKTYAAREAGQGVVLEAFRKGLKTTFCNMLSLHSLGTNPAGSVMLLRANDPAGAEGARFISRIIETSAAWRAVFQHVRPDTSVSWSSQGYEVMDTSMRYSQWRSKRFPTPSLLSLGYGNRGVFGKHPTALLIMDDLNTRNNSRGLELTKLLEIHDLELLELPVGDCQVLYAGTPWSLSDVMSEAKANPNLVKVRLPIENEDGEPSWPEVYGKEKIEELRAGMPPSSFAQMFMLDLAHAGGTLLLDEWIKWFPHEEIEEDWPVVLGVDSAFLRPGEDPRGRSYFAVAVMRKSPEGFMVLETGIRKHVSQVRAQSIIMNLVEQYGERLEVLAVEDLGPGRAFVDVLRPKLIGSVRLKAIKVSNKSKRFRMENDFAGLLQRGMIKFSDAPRVPFIQLTLDELRSFDGHGGYTDDCLDACWIASAGDERFFKRLGLDKAQGYLDPNRPVLPNPLYKFARRRP